MQYKLIFKMTVWMKNTAAGAGMGIHLQQ